MDDEPVAPQPGDAAQVEYAGARGNAVKQIRVALRCNQAHAAAVRTAGEVLVTRRLAIHRCREFRAEAGDHGKNLVRPEFQRLTIDGPGRFPIRGGVAAVMADRRVTALQGAVDGVGGSRIVREQLAAEPATASHHEAAVPAFGEAHFELHAAGDDAAHAAIPGQGFRLGPRRWRRKHHAVRCSQRRAGVHGARPRDRLGRIGATTTQQGHRTDQKTPPRLDAHDASLPDSDTHWRSDNLTQSLALYK